MLSSGTRAALRVIQSLWEAALESEIWGPRQRREDLSGPWLEEFKAFRPNILLVEGILARPDATHEDLMLLLDNCPSYPENGGDIRALIRAEREGRTVSFKMDGSKAEVSIDPPLDQPVSHPPGKKAP